MAPLVNTVAGRITLAVIGVHLLVLPALYFAMVYLVKQSNEEVFLNNVRTHARFIADSLERAGGDATDAEIVDILDSVVLSGSGVFSELSGDTTRISNSLVAHSDTGLYVEDFEFGEHGDNVYFISLPVLHDNRNLILRVGFDELPILEQNALAYKNGLAIVSVYVIVLLILLPLIGRRVVRPLKALQKASRSVASGEMELQLTTESRLVEIVDLSRDLELMRSRLTGINQQLEQEISDRKEAELQRRNLEHQLRHSQRLETVGTLAGGIAHEINNILVPIILYSDMAIEDLPEENPVREDLRRIHRAATRAKGIVSQVLTFGRKMESHEYGPIDMGEVVQESVELLQASMPAPASLRMEIDPNCPRVLGDSSLMIQLILNLGSNACQALGNKQGEVFLSLDYTDVNKSAAESNPALGTGKAVRITVRDNGTGMSRETVDRIFEPFFTTRKVGEGSGLGLSVVHGIVTDLNGAIEVESEVETGSTFRVFLPPYQETIVAGGASVIQSN